MPWSLLVAIVGIAVAVVGIAVAAGLACFETAAVVATQLPVNPALCFLSALALPDISASLSCSPSSYQPCLSDSSSFLVTLPPLVRH